MRRKLAAAALEHAAVGDAGGGDRVLAEARREHRDGGGQQRCPGCQHGDERGEVAEHGARRPPHHALDGGHERNRQVGFQEGEVGEGAVGQDGGHLQPDHEGRADDRRDDLRRKPRALGPDGAEQRDRQRDRQRRRRGADRDHHAIGGKPAQRRRDRPGC